jgi:integrase
MNAKIWIEATGKTLRLVWYYQGQRVRLSLGVKDDSIGGAIDDHNFCNRIWGSILGSCNVRYRSPYNMRHSAISHALHNGAKPIELAEQTGHDVQTMLKTYAHAIDRECLFVDINADIRGNSES